MVARTEQVYRAVSQNKFEVLIFCRVPAFKLLFQNCERIYQQLKQQHVIGPVIGAFRLTANFKRFEGKIFCVLILFDLLLLYLLEWYPFCWKNSFI